MYKRYQAKTPFKLGLKLGQNPGQLGQLRPMGFWGGMLWGIVIGAVGAGALGTYILYQTGALRLLLTPPRLRAG